eukprot:CAMPEP_0201917760 /NCGR_PEP_ID=MMETSP0903-20130614/7057_1 /ASSEMBLY_ACC=CAM_ASM_000552 /TAXON_ID=420261 /ORGANISM="Thalassiosira antarctica, Strain CCMP982" /LENGTH=41 /DNA_ID= /DNA_START= /DNA_END= /DNA_ORIENTATION=
MAITTATTRCKSNGVRDVPGMGGSNEKSSTWPHHSHHGDTW